MKPLQRYFHMVLFIWYVVLTFKSADEILWCYHLNETSSPVLSHGTIYLVCNSNLRVLWTKSFSVTIQIKPLQQYFHMVLFISYVVLTLEHVDEILWRYHSNGPFVVELWHGALYDSYIS